MKCNLFTRNLLLIIVLVFSFSILSGQSKDNKASATSPTWSVEKALNWGKSQPWLRGCNFIPSNAINSLEMFQAETFDPKTIDRELGWAEGLGLNCMRVFIHHVAWEVDKEGFKKRLSEYLSIADKHGIKTMFVLFDDCWLPSYMPGIQPKPKPGIHNSGWVQDPGDVLFAHPATSPVSIAMMNILEEYVKDVLTTFKDDKRILLWDLYNEPQRSLQLLQNIFKWAREVNPSQPLSSGVYNRRLKEFCTFQLKNSDIISYHNYSDVAGQQRAIDTLKKFNRPMICTEYMARKNNSLFTNVMPFLKDQNIGAINWGFVSGKTNTIYAWGTPMPDGSEPALWFHDILRRDGTPYKQEEVDIIKKLTGVK
jgi:Glycosyl hydrolases family 2, TIM barrel domain